MIAYMAAGRTSTRAKSCCGFMWTWRMKLNVKSWMRKSLSGQPSLGMASSTRFHSVWTARPPEEAGHRRQGHPRQEIQAKRTLPWIPLQRPPQRKEGAAPRKVPQPRSLRRRASERIPSVKRSQMRLLSSCMSHNTCTRSFKTSYLNCKDMEAVPALLQEILKQHSRSKKIVERCEMEGVDPESPGQHYSHMGWV